MGYRREELSPVKKLRHPPTPMRDEQGIVTAGTCRSGQNIWVYNYWSAVQKHEFELSHKQNDTNVKCKHITALYNVH